jgi:hypothetical protein
MEYIFNLYALDIAKIIMFIFMYGQILQSQIANYIMTCLVYPLDILSPSNNI